MLFLASELSFMEMFPIPLTPLTTLVAFCLGLM